MLFRLESVNQNSNVAESGEIGVVFYYDDSNICNYYVVGITNEWKVFIERVHDGIIYRLQEVEITSVLYEVETSYSMEIRWTDKHQFIINLNDVEILNYVDLILGDAGIHGDHAMSGYIGLQTTNMEMQVLSLYISGRPIDFYSNFYDVVADIKQCTIRLQQTQQLQIHQRYNQ